MILPVLAYGSPVLRADCGDIKENDSQCKDLISNMFETMYSADGVGLAAPQIGKNLRIFIVDASSFSEDEPDLEGFKRVFINPKILEETGSEWDFKEGCLSIPGIRENVSRKSDVRMKYLDENFVEQEEVFTGLAARVIQHEYDHIEGVLFIDKINAMKRRMLKGKLQDIIKGKVKISYRMKFPSK